MSTRAQEEVAARLAAILDGPWAQRGQFARQFLTPPKSHRDGATGGAPYRFREPAKKGGSAKRYKSLTRHLRPHWKKSIKSKEIPLRDSLDEALTELQLVELAIETGYLKEDDVTVVASKRLHDLLWHQSVRNYVRAYDYTAVELLAQRLEIDLGFSKTPVPPPSIGASEAVFAAFLSQFRLWYQDKELDLFLSFLDDYTSIGDDKDKFYEFLTRKKYKPNRTERVYFARLIIGADRLLVRLSELDATLSDDERPRYGLFHVYWMAKLFGFELSKRGYTKEDENWAKLIQRSWVLESGEAVAREARGTIAYREFFKLRSARVRKLWKTTRKFVEAARNQSVD